MYAAKERETLVIETAHFFCLGCFYVHGILQNYRGQAVKDTVFAAAVCKKCSAEQLHADGMTMQEVVDLLSDEYGWSDSVSNLSAKLQRESIRYKEVLELADVLGYDIVWQQRREK